MRWLRAGVRIPLIFLLVAVSYLVRLAGLPFVAARPRAALRWRNLHFRTLARAMLWVLGVRIGVRGRPPEPPFLLVSNHLGYLDVLVLASRLNAVFVAKSEVARWPVLGPLCRSMNTVFIDRGSRRDVGRVLAEIERLLALGEGIVLFPEGTSTRGAAVERFRPPLLEIAARAGHPVHYAALSYDTPQGERPAHLSVCWWGGMTFPDHFARLAGLPRVSASLVFGDEPVFDRDRKRLAVRLREAVSERFRPVTRWEEGCAPP